MTTNAIQVIFPYNVNGVWMFDDASKGLNREPFVSGAPQIIDGLVAGLENARTGFALYFSEQPFPGHQLKLRWLKEEMGGNWYKTNAGDEGWLCPALFKYYDDVPSTIYVKAEPRQGEPGIDEPGRRRTSEPDAAQP